MKFETTNYVTTNLQLNREEQHINLRINQPAFNRNKDFLFDRIKHEFLLYCSNLAVNSCFFISNPHKYHI